MKDAWAGGPSMEQYSYQAPIQLAHNEETRDPKFEVLDWAYTTLGATPVLTALGIGFFVMGRAALKKIGVIK